MSKRRALAERKHRQRKQRRSKLRRLTALAGATAMAVAAVVLFAADRLYRPNSFPVEQIRLEGTFKHLTPDELRSTVVEVLQRNFFALDLNQIREAVESMPWVQRARVRRVWPRGLSVAVKEHVPVAHWGKRQFVNSDGEVVTLDELASSLEMVRLNGPAGTSSRVLSNYRRWQRLLSSHGLAAQSVELDPRYAWHIRLLPADRETHIEGFTLVLGTEDVARRLRRFLNFYPELSNEEVDRLQRVDVRYPNGVAVRFAATPEQADPA